MDSSRGQPSGEGIADSHRTHSSGNRGEWAESGCSSGRRRAGNRAEREAGELGRAHRAGNCEVRAFDERIGRATARCEHRRGHRAGNRAMRASLGTASGQPREVHVWRARRAGNCTACALRDRRCGG